MDNRIHIYKSITVMVLHLQVYHNKVSYIYVIKIPTFISHKVSYFYKYHNKVSYIYKSTTIKCPTFINLQQ